MDGTRRSNVMIGQPKVCACLVLLCVAGLGGRAGAQQSTYNPPKPGGQPAAPAAAPTTRAGAGTQPATQFKPEELEQIVAPIALYPDSLLAQVLMASTYPLEIIQADRAAKANPKLKDSPDELNKLTYDPSVKSLINFPQVLTMMSEKLDWTVKLGDAFIADQKAVMDAVQKLRNKAYAAGNLKSNNEQKVSVDAGSTTAPAPAAGGGNAPLVSTQQQPQVIVIESTTPNVVYVPTYNPTVVYGAWPYPAYPPAYYYPPGYVAGAAMISFGVGMAMGAAWGHAWGGCNWHGGDVDIDVNRNVNYNTNINREKAKNEINNRQANNGNRGAGQGQGQGRFQHDASHRQGVAYRDSATNDRYRGTGNERATAQSRDAYRGRAQAGQQDIARGGAADFRGGGTPDRTGSNAFGNARTGSQGGGATAANRANSGSRSSGFGGVDSGRSGATAASNRGQTSRSGGYSSSGNRSSSSAARSAPRSSGGAARGGGGRGGGRR
jgi:hypothetical protein